MNEIEEWAKKNMYISIFTVLNNGKVEWSAGVRVGLQDKNNWLPSKDEGCQFSSFNSWDSALQNAIKYCENYKPKTSRAVPIKTKKK